MPSTSGQPAAAATATATAVASEPSGAAAAGGSGGGPDLGALTAGWGGQVLGELPLPVRSKWRGGSWVDVTDGRARFVTPNEWHKKACDDGRSAVEKALAAHFGTHITVEVVIGEAGSNGGSASGGAPGQPASSVGAAAAAGPVDEADEVLSPDEVRELKDASDVATGGVDLLLREFGGELIEEDPT